MILQKCPASLLISLYIYFYNMPGFSTNLPHVKHYLSSAKPQLLLFTKLWHQQWLPATSLSNSYFLYPQFYAWGGCLTCIHQDLTFSYASKLDSLNPLPSGFVLGPIHKGRDLAEVSQRQETQWWMAKNPDFVCDCNKQWLPMWTGPSFLP